MDDKDDEILDNGRGDDGKPGIMPVKERDTNKER
jgi:hypothetical protein